jgi:hypothetical protein
MKNIITYNEDYKIFDSLLSNPNPFAKGWVRMFLHKNPNYLQKDLIFEGSNLIMGKGREFSAQRIFNKASTGNDWKAYVLTSFGVGSGGATIESGIPIVNNPTLDDLGLTTPISLDNGYDTEVNSTITGVVKSIETDGTIELLDGEYGTDTYYSKVKCSCVIAAGVPTTLNPGESVQISEAGLYFTSGTDNVLFSHICFTPKWKEKESGITIEWYIIC